MKYIAPFFNRVYAFNEVAASFLSIAKETRSAYWKSKVSILSKANRQGIPNGKYLIYFCLRFNLRLRTRMFKIYVGGTAAEA